MKKRKIESLEKYKNHRHKTGTNFTPQLYFKWKIYKYKIQRVNCVLGYSKIKPFKFLMSNLRPCFVETLNDRKRIKSGYVDLKPVQYTICIISCLTRSHIGVDPIFTWYLMNATVNSSNNIQPITINIRPALSNQIFHHARFYCYLCQSKNKTIQNISTHEQANSNQRSLL